MKRASTIIGLGILTFTCLSSFAQGVFGPPVFTGTPPPSLVTNSFPIGFSNPSPPIQLVPWAPLPPVLPVPSCTAPPSGVVAWWPGESNADDIIGGNNSTLENGTGFAAGEVGTGFDFNGINNFVLINASASLTTGLQNGFTFEGWIKPASVGSPMCLAQYERVLGTEDGADVGMLFFVSIAPPSGTGSGCLIANIPDTGNTSHIITSAPNLVTAGTWQHVAVTYDKASGVSALYLNGVTVVQTNLGSFVPQTSYPFLTIGGKTAFGSVSSPAEVFSGGMDEFSAYNRALATNEIAAIYQAGAAGKCLPECVAPPAGIVAWWPGEDNGDDVIGGYNGSVPSDVTYTAGKVGQAFNFSGNDNITVADQPALNPTNQITLECWVYPRPSPNLSNRTQHLITKDGECSNRQYVLQIGDFEGVPDAGVFGGALWLSGTTAEADGVTAVQTNTWYHVAMTYDGTALKLYVNGALDGQVAATGTIVTGPEPVRVGGSAPDGCSAYRFNGLLDEPTIYNRALSADEIAAIYNAGSAGKCSPPPSAPVIDTPPASQSVIEGGEVDLSVTAHGAGTLTYQWLFNGVKIAGATATALSVTNIHPNQAGNYTVKVTDAAGSTTSAPAVITVTSQKVLVYNYSGTEKITTTGSETSYNFSGQLFFIPDTTNATFVGWATISGKKQYWVTSASDYQWFKITGSAGRSYTVLGKAGLTFDDLGRPNLWSMLHKGQNANLTIATGKTFSFPGTFTFSDTEVYPVYPTLQSVSEVLREASSNYSYQQNTTVTANNTGETVADLLATQIKALMKQGYQPQSNQSGQSAGGQ